MVYSVWPELEERLEFNLKSIYSPGDPDIFFKVVKMIYDMKNINSILKTYNCLQQCYNTTFAFLDKFEERCISQKSVSALRNLDSYKNFLHCWNLPIYYTLR